MGFMASFWGNMASQHQETAQIWKQLWQIDEEREQRERHFKEQAERADRQYELDRERLRESVRQFDENMLYQQARLAHDQGVAAADIVTTTFNDLYPVFQNSNPYAQMKSAENFMRFMGEIEGVSGEHVNTYGDTLLNSINTELFTRESAIAVLNDYARGPSLDAEGNVNMVNTVFARQAIEYLEDIGDAYAPDYRELFDEVSNTRASNPTYAVDANIANVDAESERRLAAVEEIKSRTGLNEAQMHDVQANTHLVRETTEANIREAMARANLSEAALEDATIRNRFLEDFLSVELEQARVDLEQAGAELKQFNDLHDIVVATAAAQLGIAEADAKVAAATIMPRIYRETLTNEHMQASIDLINHQIEMGTSANQLARIQLGLEAIASGNATMVEALWDELFPADIVDKDRFMELAIEYTQGIDDDRRAKLAAELALQQAQTEHLLEQTRHIPLDYGLRERSVAVQEGQLQVAQGHLYIAGQEFNLRAADQMHRHLMDLAPESLSANDAHKLVEGELKTSRGEIREGLSNLDRQAQDLATLYMLLDELTDENTGEVVGTIDRAALATMEPFFEQFGIVLPDYELGMPGSGEVDVSYLRLAADQAQRRLDAQTEELAGQAALFWESVAHLSSEPIAPPEEYFGFIYDPENLSPSGEAMNALYGYTSEANFLRRVSQNDAAEFAAMVGADLEIVGREEATRMVLDSLVADPEVMGGYSMDTWETMWDSLLTGPIGNLAGAGGKDPRDTFEALGITNATTLKDYMWTQNGHVEGHIANFEFVLDAMHIPVPEISASLYTGEGQTEAAAALNAAGLRLNAATAALSDGILDRIAEGPFDIGSNAAVAELSQILGVSPEFMVQTGMIVPSTGDSRGPAWAGLEDMLVPNSQAILEFIDAEAIKIDKGRGVLEEWRRGEVPSVFSGWTQN